MNISNKGVKNKLKIKAKQGKLLIISDLNITLTDDTVLTLTDEEYNSSNDIKIFKNDIDFVSDAQAAKAETKKAKVVGEVKPNVTNDSTVVTAGKTTESTPNNVFVANPAPTTETTVETTTNKIVYSIIIITL